MPSFFVAILEKRTNLASVSLVQCALTSAIIMPSSKNGETIMFYKFFDHGLSNFDSLSATVIGCTSKGVYLVAVTFDGTHITGFCPASAKIGSELVVSPVKQFNDGEFLFQIESIIETPEISPGDIIKGCIASNLTTNDVA